MPVSHMHGIPGYTAHASTCTHVHHACMGGVEDHASFAWALSLSPIQAPGSAIAQNAISVMT